MVQQTNNFDLAIFRTIEIMGMVFCGMGLLFFSVGMVGQFDPTKVLHESIWIFCLVFLGGGIFIFSRGNKYRNALLSREQKRLIAAKNPGLE